MRYFGEGAAKVGSWHKPESAKWAAIRSLAGDNRTSATLQQCNSPNSLGAEVASPHRASDRRARRVPAALFGPSHPAPGDLVASQSKNCDDRHEHGKDTKMDVKGFVVPPGGGSILSMAPGRSAALKLLGGNTGDSIMLF